MRQLSKQITARHAASDSGFSLVELAVYIVLLGIVTAIVAAVVMTSFRAEQTVSGTTSIANDAQTVVATLDRDIRNARTVAPTSGSTTTITLEVARGSGSVCWIPVLWEITGTEIARTAGTGPRAALIQGRDVDNGAFEIHDVQRSVDYSFKLSSPGTSPRIISGTTVMGPAGQTGDLCS